MQSPFKTPHTAEENIDVLESAFHNLAPAEDGTITKESARNFISNAEHE